MTRPTLERPHSHGRLAVVLLLVGLALVVSAVALHLTATAAVLQALEPGRLGDRAQAAKLAATIEPWNTEFVRHARVLRLWERGQELLDAGDYNAAVDVLREAYVNDVGDTELLALFKHAQETQALATNRKAHLQHGHEGPGGTLRPEDIER